MVDEVAGAAAEQVATKVACLAPSVGVFLAVVEKLKRLGCEQRGHDERCRCGEVGDLVSVGLNLT